MWGLGREHSTGRAALRGKKRESIDVGTWGGWPCGLGSWGMNFQDMVWGGKGVAAERPSEGRDGRGPWAEE